MLYMLFFGCAVIGGTIMFIQFCLMFMGFGGIEDIDGIDLSIPDSSDINAVPAVEHGGSYGLFRVLSFRTIVAGITLFGLGGLLGLFATTQFGIDSKYKDVIGVITACVFGLSAVYAVYYLYNFMYSLQFSGSVQENTLVGAKGTVYVTIPANASGNGKVLVNHQQRTMEYEALTKGEVLKSGVPIMVIRIIAPEIVEVSGIVGS